MSKNTIDSITEEEEIVETSTHLSSDGGAPLQEVTPLTSEPLGINEMSSPTTSNEEEELDELSSTSLPTNGRDVTSSPEGKSQLRNFLSVAKAKWDNVPQGWMQQRTNKED
tara:strand:- start:471 stop:803 length:333 start_codon:yes stop_codon:yes gene_type:complete